MKKLVYTAALAASFLVGKVQAQNVPSLEAGVRGGGTFTHGFTNVPSQKISDLVSTPELNNKSNGIGLGYSAAIWVRKNFDRFFVQAEVGYNTFLLKQKTNVPQIDVNANSSLSAALPVSVAPGLVFATLNATSESALQSINIPILIGKRWNDGKIRGYIGPNLLFVQKSEAKRVTSGKINSNAAIGFPEVQIPERSETTNLLSKREAGILEVKDFTYAIELGVGTSLIPNLEADIRYAVPVGGVYKDNNISGFLGIATVSLSYRLFKAN